MNRKTNAEAIPVLIAFKVIALADDLSAVERQVGATLLDSFNRRTGQCDPSLDRVAGLLGVHRRTVIRATGKLETKGLFRKIRHGGHSHRNQYEPLWSKFLELEARWRGRFEAASRVRTTEMSRSAGQGGHVAGGQDATQTYSTNQSTLTLPIPEPSKWDRRTVTQSSKGSAMKDQQFAPVLPSPRPMSTRSADAALAAAERHWSEDLWKKFANRVGVYAALVDFIDEALRSAATDAELRKRGAGLDLIVERFRYCSGDAACMTQGQP
ncbi:MAG: helix-turn-helix protein [Bryobacterales bacterium]|nr:helix-turn-helix protein [Bryobacterales bacterium]